MCPAASRERSLGLLAAATLALLLGVVGRFLLFPLGRNHRPQPGESVFSGGPGRLNQPRHGPLKFRGIHFARGEGGDQCHSRVFAGEISERRDPLGACPVADGLLAAALMLWLKYS